MRISVDSRGHASFEGVSALCKTTNSRRERCFDRASLEQAGPLLRCFVVYLADSIFSAGEVPDRCRLRDLP